MPIPRSSTHHGFGRARGSPSLMAPKRQGSEHREVLGGDSEKQIAAIWAYLARKNFTDLPAGASPRKTGAVSHRSTRGVIYLPENLH
jgi:hypothetical protein